MTKKYSIGSIKAKSSAIALKKARKIFKGYNVSVKLYYTDARANMYTVHSDKSISNAERARFAKMTK